MEGELEVTSHERELAAMLMRALEVVDSATALALLDAWPALPSAS